MLTDIFEFHKIKEGDIQTFEKVFRQLYTPLYLYALGITGQKEAAEEIIQDTFYILWKDREKIQILYSLRSYLYKSVRNRSIQYLEHCRVREQYRENMIGITGMADEPAPDEILEYKELENMLERTFKKLPARCRQIFRMHRVNGKKYKEIAECLSISIKTVEADMTKVYRTLRKEVNKYTQIDICL